MQRQRIRLRGKSLTHKLSSFLLFVFCFLFFAFPSFSLAAPHVYVTNEKSDDVTVIDAATDQVIATVKVGKRPTWCRRFP